ncbi:TetR family transcriptional regulator C-terminal domain-containing protein [Maritalea sp.]|uniref:TetR family transcriptional regulator C-terminal domain-containing protein n=1 Tax=Maritalea sp. TaxID=2003361 RepID=UPI003EFB1C2A
MTKLLQEKGGDFRKPSTRNQKKSAILQAAEKTFAEYGFKGATTQVIADLAGIPKANLHYYFPTKEALYSQVVQNIFDIWLDAADSFEQNMEPADALASYIDKKMEISRQHPNGSKVWANEVMHGAPIIQDYLETTLKEWTLSREVVIQSWIDKGLIDKVNPKHLLYMIWATTQHYADFVHQVETLNDGLPLDDKAWISATRDVKKIILGGVGLKFGGEK